MDDKPKPRPEGSSSRELTAEDFLGYFPKPPPKKDTDAVMKDARGSGSYDSTITDFEAERAVADTRELACDEEVWASAGSARRLVLGGSRRVL